MRIGGLHIGGEVVWYSCLSVETGKFSCLSVETMSKVQLVKTIVMLDTPRVRGHIGMG